MSKTARSVCLIFTVLAFVVTGSAFTQTTIYKIDFNNVDTSPANDGSWYTKADDGTAAVTLTDTTGSTNGGAGGNGVTMAMDSPWTTTTQTNQDGAFYATDFAFGAEDYFYVSNTTALVTFTLYGSAAENDWRVEVISSRSSSGSNRTGDYKVQGAFSDNGNSNDFNSYDDGYVAGQAMVWAQVTPDGTGRITVTVDPASSAYGYVNAIRLIGGSSGTAYSLTVNSGTGDGSYTSGSVVNIDADTAPSSQVFDAWTGDTANVADVNAAGTTISMPAADATVTATYTNVGSGPTISSVSGTISHGQSITISGSGFGIKPVAAPVKYEDFEDGSNGALLSTTNYWMVSSNNPDVDKPQFSNAETRNVHSSLSAKFIEYGGQDMACTPDLGFQDRKIYMDLWLRFQWASTTAKHQNKLFKIQSMVNSSGASNPDAYPIINFYVWRYDGGGTWSYIPISNSSGTINNDTIPNPSNAAWDHWQIEILNNDIGSANGEYRVWRNGTLIAEAYNLEMRLTGDNNFKSVWLGRYLGNYTGSLSTTHYYDDVYLDGSWARVEIGDASTWSNCTHRETQIPSAWSNGSITATVNQGSFPAGPAYLYVVDSNGVMNSSGYAVTIGGPITYTLSVNSGTGDGSYTSGTVVNISADAAPSGQAFDAWTGDTAGIADVNAASTTITMPAAATTITATYADILYALTVNSGTGDGSYTVGTVVNIDADAAPSGQAFDAWTGDTAGIADVNAASTTITMPGGDAAVTATYADIAWILTVNSGTGDGSYTVGTVVNIDADAAPSGQAFDAWTGDTAGIADVNAASTTITMPGGDATVTATYADIAWTLTVNSGSGDGSYTVGTVVDITADAAPSGQAFDAWTGDTAGIADINAASTTITMPGGDATVTATYADIAWTLTVNSGTGDGSYTVGTVVDITADAAPSGQTFDAWTGDTAGIADINAASTTITMPAAATTITATYTNIAAIVYKIDMNNADSDPSPDSSWYTKSDGSTTTATLTDSTGSTNGGTSGNGVTLTLGSNWIDNTTTNQNGAFDGGDFAAAAEDYLYVSNTTATVTFTFYGTAAESNWTVEIISSRGSSGSSRTGDYTVDGSFSDNGNSDNFNAYDDGYVVGDVMTWISVTPDGNDEITVTVAASNAGYGYVNAIRLTGEP